MSAETFRWDALIDEIKEGGVVPVIGRDLLTIPPASGHKLLDEYLAEQLRSRLGITLDAEEPLDLHRVAFRHLQKVGMHDLLIYSEVKRLLAACPFPPPDPLLKLASITDFNLFVSANFDTYMEAALNQVRFDNAPQSRSLTYSLQGHSEDLGAEGATKTRPVVFHVLGKISAGPTYAVTEEQVLESLHSLQAPQTSPTRLLGELRSKHLLFLGCGFPDWLTRFFIRALLGFPIERKLKSVADARLKRDKELAIFLRQYNSLLFDGGDAVQFVDELHQRWTEASKGQKIPSDEGARDAIFLSYASQDIDPARRVQKKLAEVGVDVWLDERELGPGSRFEEIIQQNIRSCLLFMPLISRNTQKVARSGRYYWNEWNWAVEHSARFPPTRPFLVPVNIDALPYEEAEVPAQFLRSTWAKAPGGELTDGDANFIQELVRKLRLANRAP